MAGSGAERWMRAFAVGEPRPHPRGFTLYKITSYLYPRASPEAITAITVWKRYSELQKLQRKIKALHAALYLKGTCPNFTKWSYFRRFDLEVIEERIKSTQSLLDFVALHPPLFTSIEFVKFFQSSHPDPNFKDEANPPGNIESIRNNLLLPIEATSPLEYQSSEEDSFSIIDSSTISTVDSISVNSSVFNKHVASPEMIMTKSSESIMHDIHEILQTVNNVNEEISKNISGNNSDSNDDRLQLEDSASAIFADDLTNIINKKLDLPDLISSSNNDIDITDASIILNDATDCVSYVSPLKNISNNDKTNKNGEISKLCVESNISMSQSTSNDHKKFQISNSDNKGSEVPVFNGSPSKLFDKASDTTEAKDLQENYVFEAGYLLSLGARNESKGEYSRAFECYKAGIEKMLIGVQGDKNEFRRQFVKDKTTKYLFHAEKLFTNYLADSNCEMNKSKIIECRVIKPTKTCNNSDLCKPYDELKKYRVLRVIDGRVLLVLSADNQECQIMKVIQKTCNQISDDEYLTRGSLENRLPILPTNIPHMIKLISYIETPNLLFLVLQYASGGKLFDYINKHSKTSPNTPNREVDLNNVFIDIESLERIDGNKCHMEPHDILESIELSQSMHKDCAVDDAIDVINTTASIFDANDIPVVDDNDIDDLNISVNDIVINSQRLLLDIDNTLSGNYLHTDLKDSENSKENKSSTSEKLDSAISEVEETFDEIQEKLDKIVENNVGPDSLIIKSALPIKTVCKWGAEILIAIDHLHQYGVICRNLNPDNLLLGEHGQLLLSYFIGYNAEKTLVHFLNNFSHSDHHKVYIAPELQHFYFLDDDEKFDDKVCDFWSFGVIMYELITGLSLHAMHPTGISSHTIIDFPNDISHDAKSLLTQLLCFNPRERLGSGVTGIEEIKTHAYFKHIDWNMIVENFIHANN